MRLKGRKFITNFDTGEPSLRLSLKLEVNIGDEVNKDFLPVKLGQYEENKGFPRYKQEGQGVTLDGELGRFRSE
ncbi:hypothetical protein METH109765_07285 [Mesobacillus thioparans]